MDEHVLAGGALDETITLCPVKPLYCPLLSHSTAPFAFSRRIKSSLLAKPPCDREHPLKEERTRSRFYAKTKTAPTEKAPSSLAVLNHGAGTAELDEARISTAGHRNVNLLCSPSLPGILATKLRIISECLSFGKRQFAQRWLAVIFGRGAGSPSWGDSYRAAGVDWAGSKVSHVSA